MPAIDITLNVEANPWGRHFNPDVAAGAANGLGEIIAIGRLPYGMTSGKSSVSVAIKMPNGETYWAETSMDIFIGAARAIMSREHHVQQGGHDA